MDWEKVEGVVFWDEHLAIFNGFCVVGGNNGVHEGLGVCLLGCERVVVRNGAKIADIVPSEDDLFGEK